MIRLHSENVTLKIDESDNLLSLFVRCHMENKYIL